MSPLACSDALDDTPKVIDDATETNDVADPSDADASDSTDASDPAESDGETDATEATEPSDTTDASEATDPSDTKLDASDPTDASDLAGPDIIVDPPIAEPVQALLRPRESRSDMRRRGTPRVEP